MLGIQSLGFHDKQEIKKLVMDIKKGFLSAEHLSGRDYLAHAIFRIRDPLRREAYGHVYIFGALKCGAAIFWGEDLAHKDILNIMRGNPHIILTLGYDEWDEFIGFFNKENMPKTRLPQNEMESGLVRRFQAIFANSYSGNVSKGSGSHWLDKFIVEYENLLCLDYDDAIAKHAQINIEKIDFHADSKAAILIRNIEARFNSNRSVKQQDWYEGINGRISEHWTLNHNQFSVNFAKYSVLAFYSVDRNQVTKVIICPLGEEEKYLQELLTVVHPRKLTFLVKISNIKSLVKFCNACPKCQITTRPPSEIYRNNLDFLVPFEIWDVCFRKLFPKASFESLELATKAIMRLQACINLFDFHRGFETY